MDTLHPFALKTVFWDLNCSLGCSPHGIQVYPAFPFTSFHGVRVFGVGQGAEKFPSLSPQSVALQLSLPLPALDYRQYR